MKVIMTTTADKKFKERVARHTARAKGGSFGVRFANSAKVNEGPDHGSQVMLDRSKAYVESNVKDLFEATKALVEGPREP